MTECGGRSIVPAWTKRKAGHSTAYPLSPLVGEAIIDYLKSGRPTTESRRVFFRVIAPCKPIESHAVSYRVTHYLRQAGIVVPRPGSHTLRHTCVQRLVDAGWPLKSIGDYVGHRSSASTEVYSQVATLRRGRRPERQGRLAGTTTAHPYTSALGSHAGVTCFASSRAR